MYAGAGLHTFDMSDDEPRDLRLPAGFKGLVCVTEKGEENRQRCRQVGGQSASIIENARAAVFPHR